jgi:hypothetical protein
LFSQIQYTLRVKVAFFLGVNLLGSTADPSNNALPNTATGVNTFFASTHPHCSYRLAFIANGLYGRASD